MTAKNIIGAIVLIGFFWGFIWLIGNSYYKKLDVVSQQVHAGMARNQKVVGPINVINGVCHMFFPANFVDRMMLGVVCPSCGSTADNIREKYVITLNSGQKCSRYGQNALTFTRKN